MSEIPVCTVSGGDYPIGHPSRKESHPPHTVTLAPFQLSIGAVMNVQFEAFITAGGYHDASLWGEMGLRWLKSKPVTEPAFWRDAQFNHPAQPVIGICWYEAAAYVTWLQRETGEAWRLPTEIEWEAAARGTSGAQLPEAAQVNSLERGVGRTWLAVGVGNVAACGAYNLCGNVWEWTSSRWGRNWQTLEYGYPYRADDGREDLSGSHARVMRGGSWYDVLAECHPAARGRYLPGSRASNIGFRVAKSV